MSAQYAELFDAMPTPAYLTYGNVDIPRLWADHLRDGHQVLDGDRVEIGGLAFGFVGGGLRSIYRTPNEIDDDVFAAKVEAVGEVDVLCAHIPPEVPELLFDTVAQRMERGSQALLDAVHRTQPRYLLFGHVHQPLVDRLTIGTHAVRQRRSLQGQRHAVRAPVVAGAPARPGPGRAGQEVRSEHGRQD